MSSCSDLGAVLIVAGDVMLGRALKRALARDGLTIVHAINASQALDLAEQHAPRLVLLDCPLRNGDGLKLAEEFHRRFNGLPVIAIADLPLGVKEDCTAVSRFARVLTKSFNLQDLRQAMDAALGARSAKPAQNLSTRRRARVSPAERSFSTGTQLSGFAGVMTLIKEFSKRIFQDCRNRGNCTNCREAISAPMSEDHHAKDNAASAG
jgi:DNA-binding response OmpR family regulator